MQILQNVDGFRQNNSQGFLEFLELYKQNPVEKFLIFIIYPNYSLALNAVVFLGLEVYTLFYQACLVHNPLSCQWSGIPFQVCPGTRIYNSKGLPFLFPIKDLSRRPRKRSHVVCLCLCAKWTLLIERKCMQFLCTYIRTVRVNYTLILMDRRDRGGFMR